MIRHSAATGEESRFAQVYFVGVEIFQSFGRTNWGLWG